MKERRDPPPGRAKADQPPGGAATREAAARGAPRFTDDYLGYLLGQANHALFKEFDAQVREAGLGSLEWRVLAVLSGESPMAVGRLAHEVLSQQPTVTKLLQRLVVQGWVALHDDPADQRRTLVSITPAGQKKVAPLLRRARAHEAAMLAELSAAEVQRLKTQLKRLAQPR
ncbi:MAG: winged helix-turn-helix transcriptional regulator [Comamonadaceae bacterium]|uniref:MarR family winged helix-turn-helix transcriptional regulator n=1 Tax=Hydrogenophaga sp. SNF1 TaxID=3098762 RepID=UPI002ACBEDC8|nr:MarR family winged helix-turn-helix transcriptional regulator [Hydrogenophaga sp. SNF1]NCT98259.1 winged helix-turn-helix transcriptional regulator [Comamonadaceae bacterium]WQB83871.1 MarR family winged helix-turn-helix transcriptional regulator [Hydrogenophaga sp. SNF1]